MKPGITAVDRAAMGSGHASESSPPNAPGREEYTPPGAATIWVLIVEVGGEELALELAVGRSRPGLDGLVAGAVQALPPRVDLREALGRCPRATPGRAVRVRIAGAGVVELVADRVCEAMQVSVELVTPAAGGGGALQLDDRVMRVLPARALLGPDSLAA